MPFYVLGRELTGVYPVGFLPARHALALAIISYNGRLGFGLLADRASIPDSEQIAAYLDEAVEELLAAARVASGGDGDQLAGDLRPRLAGELGGLAGG
jgi:hypothetical protein